MMPVNASSCSLYRCNNKEASEVEEEEER
jgi:hypothetical protein